MKILRLSLNNLASLAGTHHIPFHESPLEHAGLIAITGKTGAGKSTLLDAMCLALYNEVPRLKGAAGSLKDTGGQDISIKDSKNILRRGTTSGFAELEFIALDGKRYQARWDIRRARNKVDGNLKVERAITCLDDQRVLNQKISEATPIIEKLIGLSFEQFTRAVLLAQSEVGAFLKAKDNERADLLEYLTNSQIFSLVSIKAAEKNSQIKQQRIELEKLVGHIEMLTQEEVEHLNQQQKELSLQLQNLQQSEKLLENEKKWHLDRNRMYADVHGKKEIYDVQLDAVNKSAAQQQLLEQLDQFQSIREHFVQRTQLEAQQQQLIQQQQDFKTEFESLEQNVTLETAKLNQIKQDALNFQRHRESVQPFLEQGLKLDHEINSISEQYKKQHAELLQFKTLRISPLLEQQNQQQQNLNQAQTQLNQVQQLLSQTDFLSAFDQEPQSVLQRLNDYATHQAVLKDKLKAQQQRSTNQNKFIQTEWNSDQLQQQIREYNQHLTQWTTHHQSLELLDAQLKQSQQQQQNVQKQIFQIDSIQQRLTQLATNISNAYQMAADLKTHQQQFSHHQTDILQLQTQLDTDQLTFQQLENILLQQRVLHTQSVQELRAQLKAGEACMVCGSHEHPFIDNHTLLEHNLHQLQEQQLEQAKAQLHVVQQQLQAKHIERSKLEILIEQQQHAYQNLSQHNAEVLESVNSLLQNLGVEVQPNAEIEQLIQLAEQHCQKLNLELNTLSQQENELQHTSQQWRLEAQHIQELRLLAQDYQILEQLIQPIQKALPPQYQTQAPMQWLAYIQEQIQQRQHELNEHKRLESEIMRQQQWVEKSQYQLQLEQQNLAQLEKNIEQLIQQGKDLRQQLADLTQRHAHQVYRIAAEWRIALEQQAKIWEQTFESQRQSVVQVELQFNQAKLKQQALSAQVEQLQKQLNHALNTIQTWQNHHPDVTTSMVEHYLSIDLAQHQAIRRDLNNQRQLLDNAKTAWLLLEEQFQAHLSQQPTHSFEQVEAKLSTLVTEKTALQHECNAIAAQLHMNANNQATYAKYQDQIEKIKTEEYRWGRIYDLIGHKEGTKFQKIAQEHHLDILVEYANQQLQPLSPRYQLHRIPDSLSLAIIDLDMNSEIRPVLSLSGGETFLVSLALALAIANMASGSMKLESLFIDEGFGTLDPASLHMVMNALDHLQSQGRKVILISHVQEMHERIPVQIQVKPVGAGASTVHIVG